MFKYDSNFLYIIYKNKVEQLALNALLVNEEGVVEDTYNGVIARIPLEKVSELKTVLVEASFH